MAFFINEVLLVPGQSSMAAFVFRALALVAAIDLRMSFDWVQSHMLQLTQYANAKLERSRMLAAPRRTGQRRQGLQLQSR